MAASLSLMPDPLASAAMPPRACLPPAGVGTAEAVARASGAPLSSFLRSLTLPPLRPAALRQRRAAARSQAAGAPEAAQAPAVVAPALRTCRQCKKAFDPATNTPSSCRFHPAHYGGEIKRKWKSYKYHEVGTEFLYHSDETKANWGEVETYWDCCGNTDPEDLGCEIGPHRSYDD